MITALFFLLAALIKNFTQIPASLFESDQETLTIAAKNILGGHFSLIGAPTSVGGMFIAPLYNYFVAIWLWIFRGSPYTVSILGAIWLSLLIPAIYLVGKKIYSGSVGVFAAIIALLSINFVNFDQVPPLLFPLPLLTVILIYVLETEPATKFRKAIIGAVIGLTLNLHFSGVFLAPLLLISGIWGSLALLILVSPLILFDIRHQWWNIGHAVEFLSKSGAVTSLWFRLDTFLVSFAVIFEAAAGAGMLVKTAMGAVIVWGFLFTSRNWPKVILGLTFIFFMIYGGSLIPYYGIISWVPFILIAGCGLERLWAKGNFIKSIIVLTGVFFLIMNFKALSNRSASRGLDKKIAALEFIKNDFIGREMYLSINMDPAANFGFTYLTGYVGIKSTPFPVKPTYTLLAPYDWLKVNPDKSFGDFGVLMSRSNE
ncbi:glycosyltransferase family 39 protein [Candidatus Collierbacteria bacterium]|nr:glycosyltransferase family 39 protein [Candidatus Collierbacteria bacterium]